VWKAVGSGVRGPPTADLRTPSSDLRRNAASVISWRHTGSQCTVCRHRSSTLVNGFSAQNHLQGRCAPSEMSGVWIGSAPLLRAACELLNDIHLAGQQTTSATIAKHGVEWASTGFAAYTSPLSSKPTIIGLQFEMRRSINGKRVQGLGQRFHDDWRELSRLALIFSEGPTKRLKLEARHYHHSLACRAERRKLTALG